MPCGCAKCWEDGIVAAKKKAEDTGVELGSRNLTEGDSGDDVRVVQEYVLTEASGDYDAATTRAVKVWQKANGRQPSGNVGPAEWKRIVADVQAQ